LIPLFLISLTHRQLRGLLLAGTTFAVGETRREVLETGQDVMRGKFATFHKGTGPLVAVAVHSGHALRPELARYMALDDAARRREEDPFSGRWAVAGDSRVIVHQSRFEVDLNRPREGAIYRTPAAAWGLEVWRGELPVGIVDRSLARYDRFYRQLRALIRSLLKRHPRVVVFDLHTYNHRRGGARGAVADPAGNPEINIGTGTMQRERWAALVDRFIGDLRRFDFLGRHLDVRENVRFQGGQIPRWVHQTFPRRACALAIEVKKFFMDEWTCEVDAEQLAAVGQALRSTVPGILEELDVYDRGRISAA
jgi:N-formylglutamate amidohydrolase